MQFALSAVAALLAFSAGVYSQASTAPIPAATPSATVVPSTSAYTYFGCYNETTGDTATGNARALSGGSMNASDSMTVQKCLKICGRSQYAGLEYGRECWCGLDLNSLSTKLPESKCALGCSGNSSQICGDALREQVSWDQATSWAVAPTRSISNHAGGYRWHRAALNHANALRLGERLISTNRAHQNLAHATMLQILRAAHSQVIGGTAFEHLHSVLPQSGSTLLLELPDAIEILVRRSVPASST
ncbi:MAG: hypothetical protein Q9222_000154 [Ikaeria aurantiellina]